MLCLFLLLFSSDLQAQYRFRKTLDLSLGSATALGLGTCLYIQKKTPALTEAQISLLNRQDVPAFDRRATYYWSPAVARASDGLAIATCLLPLYFAFDQKTKAGLLPVWNVTYQSTVLSLALANSFKLAKRERPFLYNENAPLSKKLKADARMSFFSAHTATVSAVSFSFAFAWKEYHPGSGANPYVYAGAAILPAIEAVLRVRAGKHFPTDVITGYLCGLGSAYLMHRLHKQ